MAFIQNIIIQGNRKDMQKIQVTRQFCEASVPQGHFFKQTKNPFLDKVYGSMCAKFQVSNVFHLARSGDAIHTAIYTHIHTYTSEIRNIRLLGSRGFRLFAYFSNKNYLPLQ